MTEKILSAGVYQSENDQSFYTQGNATTGLAVVGPTQKGPAFVPIDVTSYSQFTNLFGSDASTNYTTQTVYSYLQAGSTVKVTRILGNGGWVYNNTYQLAAIVTGSTILSVLYPTQNNTTTVALNGAQITGSFGSFNINLTGSYSKLSFSASLDPTSTLYISKVLGNDANHQTGSVFPYLLFDNYISSASIVLTSSVTSSFKFTTTACTFTSSYAGGYSHATTPWILSDSGIRLFKFHHRSDGFKTNTDVKISLSNITVGATPSTYSTFDILVRAWNDSDKYPSILEQYIGVSLDPNSANFIAKMIGDKYLEYNDVQGKVIEYGNYDNVSNYIRVEVVDGVTNATAYPQLIPNGYEAVYETIAGISGSYLPSASVSLSNTGSYVYSGFDYSNTDNYNYLNPVPLEAGVGLNANFTKPSNDNKFIIPFQGGSDGMNYVVIPKIGSAIAADGTNVFGYNLSSTSAAGYISYKKALDILVNAEEYVFDLLALPGVIDEYHGAVTAYAQSIAETRTDCVYIRDLTGMNSTIVTATSLAAGIDSSYCSTYYSWVKVNSVGSSKQIIVPPSVVVPQAYAYNDRVAAAWYAPAGLSRGILGAVDTRFKLSKSDRDTLYAARINPIAKFPNTGVVIWGQKTMQKKDTALNRINVRRLLIDLRTHINQIAKYFVFENNTVATRNKLVNQIVPYMENVQSRQGLYAFRVQIDETLNTNDVIDRNQLVGKIFVSPTKSIEFILLEFNITATGATFQ